ncbi:MAG: FAD-dependent oxidoreductase [Chlamydiota bacterium]
MKIAIIGGGLAGLGVLWPLLQSPHAQVSLFDARGIGGGASGISTGLLHPFPGSRALRSWQAEEGMLATKELLQVVENTIGHPVVKESGVLRLAITDAQKKDFRHRCENDPDTIWWDEAKVATFLPKATIAPALWIPTGSTIYTHLYLKGLWQACQEKGAKLELQNVPSLQELEEFDAIILATGAETLHFKECSHLPIKPTKGQTLVCKWPEPLPVSLVSQGHLTPTSDPQLCQIGSTYERIFTSVEPDPKIALTLLEKAAQFYPPARDFEVVEIRAGVRIARAIGYRPVVEKISPKAWVFTGLGSRGMLYHAWLGKELARAILEGRDSLELKEL